MSSAFCFSSLLLLKFTLIVSNIYVFYITIIVITIIDLIIKYNVSDAAELLESLNKYDECQTSIYNRILYDIDIDKDYNYEILLYNNSEKLFCNDDIGNL